MKPSPESNDEYPPGSMVKLKNGQAGVVVPGKTKMVKSKGTVRRAVGQFEIVSSLFYIDKSDL